MARPRFVPRPGLDAIIAERFAAPAVTRLAAAVVAEAARAAPPVHLWVTMRDPVVRVSHAATDAQAIPGNLRFILPRPGHADYAAGRELAREPGDPALSDGNLINCRCSRMVLPGRLGHSINATDTVVLGATARAEVQTRFPRAPESEFPGPGDGGGGWLRGAAATVAAAHRARLR